MRRTSLLVLLLFGATWSLSVLAGPRPAVTRPDRYAPHARDMQLAQSSNPVDGTVWVSWASRNGAEYDLAINVAGADGLWAEPLFLGEYDGIDQIDPALAIDARGNVYVSYVELQTGRLLLTTLQARTGQWTTRALMPEDPRVLRRLPALRIVGERLIVAFRHGQQIEILDLPLLDLGPVNGTSTIADGPDPVGASTEEKDTGNEGSTENETSFPSEWIRPLGLARGGSSH